MSTRAEAFDIGSRNRQRLTDVADVDAAGFAELRLGTPPAGSYWLVDRGAFVAIGPAGGSVLLIVYGGPGLVDDNIEDFAELDVGAVQSTVRAVGEWSPAIWIPSGGELIVTFEGCVAGTQASASAKARIIPVA